MLTIAAAVRMLIGASVFVIAKCGMVTTHDAMYVANGTSTSRS